MYTHLKDGDLKWMVASTDKNIADGLISLHKSCSNERDFWEEKLYFNIIPLRTHH